MQDTRDFFRRKPCYSVVTILFQKKGEDIIFDQFLIILVTKRGAVYLVVILRISACGSFVNMDIHRDFPL